MIVGAVASGISYRQVILARQTDKNVLQTAERMYMAVGIQMGRLDAGCKHLFNLCLPFTVDFIFV